MTLRTIVAALVVVAIGATGCGGSSNSNSSSTSSSNSPSGAGQSNGSSKKQGAAKGQLTTEADPKGGLSFKTTKLTAKAGRVTIAMVNPAGSGTQHGIGVEGKGVDQDGPVVKPGKTATLTVSLKKGKYEFYCPFDGHKKAGMTGSLTVK